MHFPILPLSCTIALTAAEHSLMRRVMKDSKMETIQYSRKIYVAGPMRGIKDFNFPAFFDAQERLEDDGWIVFNPAARDEKLYGTDVGKSETGKLEDTAKTGFSLREALADDTSFIALEADAIYMLPGWEKSKGATAERALAEALSLEIIYGT